ncbi:MAG: hypothetical protein HY709_06830 [Candidatus Latescibacteria bacterium]|nr:hypothetical protein [Candidatus Latescibacterota bacterium]
MKRSFRFAILLFFIFPFRLEADRKVLMLGGNGRQWGENGNKITAFDVTASNALQLREYLPDQNILRMLDAEKDPVKAKINGGWFIPGQISPLEQGYVQDEDPRAWFTEIERFVDGVSTPASATTWTLNPLWSNGATFIFETGLPVRARRIVFYPPQSDEIEGWTKASYKSAYIKAFDLTAGLRAPQGQAYWLFPPFEIILRQEPNNIEPITAVDFPLQLLRFFRLQNTTPRGFSITEIELYGEGFAPVAKFASKVIDLEGPVNLGRLFFDFKKFRWQKQWEWKGGILPGDTEQVQFAKRRRVIPELWQIVEGDPEPLLWPGAPVSIAVEMRSGRDDTPLVYHKINDTGDGEVVVTKDEYFVLKKAPLVPDPIWGPLLPGMQGSVTDDVENWSQWSSPGRISGEEPVVPDFRQYVQFRITVRSDDPWAFGRLDSLWVEYSSPLVQEAVGEVAVLGDPQPQGGIVEVEGGHPVTLTYDIGARFSASTQRGFDLVRIFTPSMATFEGLSMGKPLQKVEPAQPAEWERGMLEVYLPRKVTRANNEPVQVVFETVVLAYGTEFRGEVWDTQSQDLPQTVVPGNASDEVSTNTLQVLVTERSLKEVLTDVEVKPNPITPDGNNRNDSATITYTLLRVTGDVEVEVGIYDLSGARVKTVVKRREGSGHDRVVEWDGKDEERRLVRPGVYLCRVRVSADREEFEKVRPITVVY